MDVSILAGFCTQLLVLLPGPGFCAELTDLEISRGKKASEERNSAFLPLDVL